MRRSVAWGIGVASLAAAWAIGPFVPTEDDVQAPFYSQGSLGGPAVTLREASVRLLDASASEELQRPGYVSATSQWVSFTLEATGHSNEGENPQLKHVTLHVGDRVYSPTDQTSVSFASTNLVTGVPRSGPVVFEIAKEDAGAPAELQVSTRVLDERLDAVATFPVDLSSVKRVDSLNPSTPDWSAP